MSNVKNLEFVAPDENNNYCIFPEQYENDNTIAFHGTSMEFFESIINSGLASAKLLGFGELTSVSYVMNSNAALAHVCERFLEFDRVIFAVSLKSIKKETIVPSTSVFYVHDPNQQPKIIAYCVVPKGFQLL